MNKIDISVIIPVFNEEGNIKRLDEEIKEVLPKVAPETFGKPLRKSLSGYRSLRVGDYRVIFRIEKSTVKIFAITHRSIVYKVIERRI